MADSIGLDQSNGTSSPVLLTTHSYPHEKDVLRTWGFFIAKQDFRISSLKGRNHKNPSLLLHHDTLCELRESHYHNTWEEGSYELSHSTGLYQPFWKVGTYPVTLLWKAPQFSLILSTSFLSGNYIVIIITALLGYCQIVLNQLIGSQVVRAGGIAVPWRCTIKQFATGNKS